MTAPDQQPETLSWDGPVVAIDGGTTTTTWRTRVPPTYVFFEGHFPGFPVLAGAVQLHELVLPCLHHRRQGARIAGLSGVKFPARIRPGDPLEVSLVFEGDSPRVRFEIRRRDVVCTHGVLVLVLEAP